MSGVYDDAEEARENKSYCDYLQQLIDQEEVTGAAAGIVKKVIAEGEDGLSDKQKYVFESQVRGPHLSPTCSQCGQSLNWDEARLNLIDGSDLCGGCAHDAEKRQYE